MQIILICFIITQWGPDTRMTFASGYSCNGLQRNGIAVGPSNRVHVCWWDDRTGNAEIYYKQSTDGGETWGADIRLTDTTGTDYDPAIVCAGSKVHIIWRCGNRIFYLRSTDAGQTWLPKTLLHSGGIMLQSPCIAASGDTVYTAWVRAPGGFPPYQALLRRSLDGGVTWLDTIRVSPPGYDTCADCALVVDKGKRVHFFWTNSWFSVGPYWGLYTRKSTDFGATWSAPVELETPSAITLKFSCAAGPDSNVLHYIVLGNSSGGTLYNLKYRRSSDGGASWNQYFFKAAGASWTLWEFPEVAVDTSTGQVHLAWVWNATSSLKGEIMYNQSTDNGLNWGTDERLTYDDSVSTRPSISCGSVHLIWSDTRDGNYEIYYKKKSTIGIEQTKTGMQQIENAHLEVYPNPFHGKTNIKYTMQDSRHLSTGQGFDLALKIYDAGGRLVKQFGNITLHPVIPVVWHGDDDLGQKVPGGVYFIVACTENRVFKRKVLLIR